MYGTEPNSIIFWGRNLQQYHRKYLHFDLSYVDNFVNYAKSFIRGPKIMALTFLGEVLLSRGLNVCKLKASWDVYCHAWELWEGVG